MHYKKFIRQWKHKLKDAQLFVTRQLAQSGKQDKTFTVLARHDIRLPRASRQVLSYTSDPVSGEIVKYSISCMYPL
jgi:esterase/lipase superfamily enzyme